MQHICPSDIICPDRPIAPISQSEHQSVRQYTHLLTKPMCLPVQRFDFESKTKKAQCINLITRLCSSVYPSVLHSICTPIRPSVRVGAHQHTHESIRNDLAQGGHESASISTPITQPCRPSGASALTRMRGQRKGS